MQGEQQYGSAVPTGTVVQPTEQQYGSNSMPTGAVIQPTGHIVSVEQAPQAIAIAEPIAADPIAFAAVVPSMPSGRDFIPRNQSPPTAGYLFGEGEQGWGYYAVGSAGCDALALRLLYARKTRSEKALRNVRLWSFMFCCLLSQRRNALEAHVREYNGLLEDAPARADWAARMGRGNPEPQRCRRHIRGGDFL